MKLATLDTGGDGTLLIVSRDLSRAARAEAAPTLQAALDDWERVEPALRRQAEAIEAGTVDTIAVDPLALAAVLPRSYQFLDASAFLAHNHILARAWGFEPRGEAEPPLMYQGLSDRFYAPHVPVPFRGFDDEVDFEAEYGVITDAVPMGISPGDALGHVRLLVIINDWSLRAFGPAEMRGGFGFLHAKPPSTLSAFAVTPDELGDAWHDGRIALPLQVELNGASFGRPHGAAMHFGFGELIAHAATTRALCAGTVIGSGTVSNYDADQVGSACLAERRALDALAGRALTSFLKAGDRVAIEARGESGDSLFGRIEQSVVTRTL
jgi:fumarylacetoacetate (FAA) hydrolase